MLFIFNFISTVEKNQPSLSIAVDFTRLLWSAALYSNNNFTENDMALSSQDHYHDALFVSAIKY